MLDRVRRSLLTAWTPAPEGPRWAPWAWTAALNTLVAAVLTVVVPRGGTFASYLLISQMIGLTVHTLFWGLGRTLALDLFGLTPALRVAYVVSVVLAGSWLGYAGATWILLGDVERLVRHMTRAAPFLAVMPVLWALVTLALFAGVNRLRAGQLARERERSARLHAEREAMAARLQLLNAQIEPHFLYNTLAHVSALATGNEAAQRLLDALIRYLRASARNMSHTLVPLAEELQSVRGYLDVMQLRLRERLRVRYAVPPQAMALRLPPAALQTLVENAVKHGIEPGAHGGEILVSARAEGADWWLEVSDPGAQPSAGPMPVRAGTGTGLANLGERLRLALGPAATVTLQPAPGGGTLARITIPAQQAS